MDTNRSRDILSLRLTVLVKTLVDKKKYELMPPPSEAGRPTLKSVHGTSASNAQADLISPTTPGVKSCSTPGTLGMMKQTKPSNGYRVVDTRPNSPAAKLGVVTFEDVIIALNGQSLEVPAGAEASHLSKHLNGHLEKSVVLTVYNTKSRGSRDITFVPTRRWLSYCFIGIDVRYDPLVLSEVILPV